MEDLGGYLGVGARLFAPLKSGRPRRDGISGAIDLLISMFAVRPADVRETGDRPTLRVRQIRFAVCGNITRTTYPCIVHIDSAELTDAPRYASRMIRNDGKNTETILTTPITIIIGTNVNNFTRDFAIRR